MIRRSLAVALVAIGLLCLVNLNPAWVQAQQDFLATIVRLQKPDATRANFRTVNEITEAATKLGTVATVTATGLTIQPAAASDYSDLYMRTNSMSFPIRQTVGFSDFGTGQIHNSWSIQFNEGGTSPLHPRWGENIEVFYDTGAQDLVEKNWSYTSIDGATSYRPMTFNLDVATHKAAMHWHLEDFRILSRQALVGGRPEFMWIVNPDLNISTTYAPLGIGGDPRSDANGPQLKILGSSGTGQSFVHVAPAVFKSGDVAVHVDLPATTGEVSGLRSQGAINGLITSDVYNAHATGSARQTVTTAGTGSSYLFTNNATRYWTAGLDGADGKYKIDAQFVPGAATAFDIDFTSFAATHYGGLRFSGTTHSGLRLNSLTTTQRNALTPVAGDVIYNTTTGQPEAYTTVWGALGGGGGSVATDAIWDAAGDLAVGTGSNTAARLAMGTSLQVLRVNAGGTALEYAAPGGGGDALVANNLDQFASVTQTAGQTLAITSSTTLSGGTHSGTNTGDQTNIAGNAATVTTNANLTGHVTSTGNSAVLGSFTAAQLNTAISDADMVSNGSNTFTAQQIIGANGAASTPPVIFNGTIFTGGSATTTKPQLLIEPTGATSTAWNTDGTGVGVNAGSGFAGNLVDLQVNGASKFSVDENGLIAGTMKDQIGIACSDETTAITTGTGKTTFRMPYAMTLTAVRCSAVTAPTGSTLTVDINEGGTTILSTKLTIDATEETSTTAAAAAVISDASLADDAKISVDFDQVGSTISGAGIKIWLIGVRQ